MTFRVDRSINRATWKASHRAFRICPSKCSVDICVKYPFVDLWAVDASHHLYIKEDNLAFRSRIVRSVRSIKSYILIDKTHSVGLWRLSKVGAISGLVKDAAQ